MSRSRRCCSCSLRAGGVIIGWVGMVFSALMLTDASVSIANDKVTCDYNNTNASVSRGKNKMPCDFEVSIFIPCELAVAILGFLTHMLVLTGSVTGKAFLLLPYLIIQIVNIVLQALVIIVAPFLFAHVKDILGDIIVYGFYLLVSIYFSLIIYCWVCVLNLFIELRQMRSHETNQSLHGFQNEDLPHLYSKLS